MGVWGFKVYLNLILRYLQNRGGTLLIISIFCFLVFLKKNTIQIRNLSILS